MRNKENKEKAFEVVITDLKKNKVVTSVKTNCFLGVINDVDREGTIRSKMVKCNPIEFSYAIVSLKLMLDELKKDKPEVWALATAILNGEKTFKEEAEC